MFGKGNIIIHSSAFKVGAAIVLFSCTRTNNQVEIPTRPVASPTSTQPPLRNNGQDQEHQEASGPEVPFDGGKPEALVVPLTTPLPTVTPNLAGEAEKVWHSGGIYSELTGQTRMCEGTDQ